MAIECVHTQNIAKNSGLPGMERVKAWDMKAIPVSWTECMYLPKFICEALTPNVMVFGSGAFGP